MKGNIAHQINKIFEEEGQTFDAIVRASGLDPSQDFQNRSLLGFSFVGSDLRGFNFCGSDLRGAEIRKAAFLDSTTVVDKNTKLDASDKAALERPAVRGGQRLVAITSGAVILFDHRTGQVFGRAPRPAGACVAVHSSGRLAISNSSSEVALGEIGSRKWERASDTTNMESLPELYHELIQDQSPATSLCWLTDSSVVVGDKRGAVRLLDKSGLRSIEFVQGPVRSIYKISEAMICVVSESTAVILVLDSRRSGASMTFQSKVKSAQLSNGSVVFLKGRQLYVATKRRLTDLLKTNPAPSFALPGSFKSLSAENWLYKSTPRHLLIDRKEIPGDIRLLLSGSNKSIFGIDGNGSIVRFSIDVSALWSAGHSLERISCGVATADDVVILGGEDGTVETCDMIGERPRQFKISRSPIISLLSHLGPSGARAV